MIHHVHSGPLRSLGNFPISRMIWFVGVWSKSTDHIFFSPSFRPRFLTTKANLSLALFEIIPLTRIAPCPSLSIYYRKTLLGSSGARRKRHSRPKIIIRGLTHRAQCTCRGMVACTTWQDAQIGREFLRNWRALAENQPHQPYDKSSTRGVQVDRYIESMLRADV